ncbi:MAG: EAL domain-containing protein [Ruminococcaceae bacterium]|nr:EAL domain-containing protein [Oscillospiraceae bacterium]
MPKEKERSITKTSLTSVFVAILFVIAYVLMITFTYNRLFLNAADAVLKSAISSATSFSKVIISDNSQMDFVHSEFMQTFEKDKKEMTRKNLTNFFNEVIPNNCYSLTFFTTDGDYISSTGETGKISNIESFKKAIGETDFFVTNIFEGISKDFVHYTRIVEIDGKTHGYIVGMYNYGKVFNDLFPTELYKDNSLNIIVDKKGSILFSTKDYHSGTFETDNFFKLIEEHKYDSQLVFLENKNALVDSEIATISIDGKNYCVAYASVEDLSGLYIARILPVNSLFSQTGMLLTFLVLTSLMFLLSVVILSYRYYKTIGASNIRVKTVAFLDPLTGFANFSKFKEEAHEKLVKDRSGEYYICCVDMVGFRYINDTFGYDTGDFILVEITKEINNLLLEDELFARISGDKFVILTKRDLGNTDTNHFIYQLTDRISTIKPLAEAHIRLETQMGVYKILPGDIDEMSINALYDRALVALHSIKYLDTGIAIYDISVHNAQIEKKDIEAKMYDALKNGEFRVYIQPKYRTINGKLAGGEALIRWIDPEKGVVPPIKFIPIFEQNRFVHNIDLYVMEVVSRFIRMRLNDGLPVVPISLNISPVEITMLNFRESYIAIKDKYEIPDGLIELEFTESIFFENEKLFKETIVDLQKHGFTCSMDDFGSGYSSLNILKELPVNTLKLDKLFFRESENAERDRSIIRSVIAMARSLGIKTVAEGVETLDVAEYLKLVGCTLIQGYIYSKPLPLTEFEEKLDNENLDTDSGYDHDFDKFEVVPLDMPLSSSIEHTLRKAYAAIVEINTGGNIYHIYYPGDKNVRFDAIPERGFYSAFTQELAPKYVHPKDLEMVQTNLNPLFLSNHFKTNSDLGFEYRHMRKDGSYSWMKLHIIKARGGRTDSQIFFAYFNIIDDYKETEEILETMQKRFSAAYSHFNGAVFELDLTNATVEFLETHSVILEAVKDVKEFDVLLSFIVENLLHPDYREVLATVCSIEHLRRYFMEAKNKESIIVEVQAKPSRKVSTYSYYVATFSVQGDSTEKILLTVEDITEEKIKEVNLQLQHYVTDVAFSNVFEAVFRIMLKKDLFDCADFTNKNPYPKSFEGKYSLYVENMIQSFIKETDRETVRQTLSLEGLINFYNDKEMTQFQVAFQERAFPGSEDYVWKEILVIAKPFGYGQDETVYLFKSSVNEFRETEKNLNEYAYRLSYALAMFDYCYSVDCNTEEVQIIGGKSFENYIWDAEKLDYSKLSVEIKNAIIAEEDQSAFRRLTYLDELTEYFQNHSAYLIKYFKSNRGERNFAEVTIVYGTREQKITIFIRNINADDFGIGTIDTSSTLKEVYSDNSVSE